YLTQIEPFQYRGDRRSLAMRQLSPRRPGRLNSNRRAKCRNSNIHKKRPSCGEQKINGIENTFAAYIVEFRLNGSLIRNSGSLSGLIYFSFNIDWRQEIFAY
ncbi:MAG: hypothetical protein KDF64_16150, partial [Geminicoccaceae bacterium]|nr:hypothetical protein [Geminicoccaceae bacterium]